MYRFRSTKKLFEFKELEDQIIYFAHPNQLNDPMEGHRELIWIGDYIQWKALFKHYILCFDGVYFAYLIRAEDTVLSSEYIPSFMSDVMLPTDENRTRISEINQRFFSISAVDSILKFLGSLKTYVTKNELEYYLKSIQPKIVELINAKLNPSLNTIEMSSRSSLMLESVSNMLKISSVCDEPYLQNGHRSSLFKIFSNTSMQMELINIYNSNIVDANFKFINIDFAKEYLNKLESLVYPNWYVACFMENSCNSALWGYYGDNHAGVCLKFKTKCDNSGSYIELQTPTNNLRRIRFPLKKVEYRSDLIQINVFNSLGRLPLNQIHDQWMCVDGITSNAYSILASDLDSWREEYQSKYVESITTKTKDWERENEYRIFIDDMLENYSSSEMRKFKYEFEDLESIIFGLNTTRDDKIKIMMILEPKIRNSGRTDFTFYQAYITNGKLEYEPLSLIKVEAT